MSFKGLAINAGKKVADFTPYEIRQRRRPEQSLEEAVIFLRSLVDTSTSLPFVRTFVQNLVSLPQMSCAQIAQDYFALAVAENKRNGYFVEFGAADGVCCSNSFLLEKEFGWDGIIAEPNRAFLPNIEAHRNCRIERDCVWSRTGENLSFLATDEGTLSTISSFATTDHHDRSKATKYDVRTISLADMLSKHGAPSVVDYMSIDTEGSEFEILAAFAFDLYTIRCFTIEHNHVADRREKIAAFLASKGYIRVLSKYTQFDDWYVHQSVLVK